MAESNRRALRELVEGASLSADRIAVETRSIYDAILAASRYLKTPNFTAFHPDDLQFLFQRYDQTFFGGHCRDLVADAIQFRISPRMTKAGGKTSVYRRRDVPEFRSYEIAVSSTLLFQTFGTVERAIRVTGVECRDRLEALQRIFEHEMIHLVEFLLWDTSQCSENRYQAIASGLFGHTDHRHQLVTTRETACRKFGIHIGSRVRFRFEGMEHVGVVNRITRRATVLVENDHGSPYSDGKRYSTYYIPLGMLNLVE